MASIEEVEKVAKEFCNMLGISWDDFLAFMRVMRIAKDWSNVTFRAAGMEIEIRNEWKGLSLRITKHDQGVKTTKEYDLSYLRISPMT